MYNNILEVPLKTASIYPKRISHKSNIKKNIPNRTYGEFVKTIALLTAGFEHFGMKKSDHISFFVNNRFEWIVTDFAIMALRAISVPRGSDTTPKESHFIYNHSDSKYLIVENVKQLSELIEVFDESDWNSCKSLFIIDEGDISNIPENLKNKIHFYKEVLEFGSPKYEKDPQMLDKLSAKIKAEDLLTIVYTSGTTGNPKGVMLTHSNFLQNIHANTPRLGVDIDRPEVSVVMLPSWHVYERAFEYCAYSAGMTLVYSAPGRFGVDLIKEKPQVLISVPRMWESIYQKMLKTISTMSAFKRTLLLLFIRFNKTYLVSKQYLKGDYISLKKRSWIRKVVATIYHFVRIILYFPGHFFAGKIFKPFMVKLGGRLRVATSAAGALPKYIDEFFNALNIPLVNAYGMTETAPGILSRTIEHNTFNTTGIPFDNTEVEIRREDGSITKIGEKGVVFVRGPQVMLGYYKNKDATDKVLSKDGWLNTGDLAVRSENGEIIIVGRMKDTIVLMGGENVEPEPIEEKMKESVYIDHAVVLGQDKKQLTAIVAVNEEELMKLAAELKLSYEEIILEGKGSITHEDIMRHLMKEVNSLINKEHGFKNFEFVTKILAVKNDFLVGKELTQTLKIKRKYIEDRYQNLLSHLQDDIKKHRKK